MNERDIIPMFHSALVVKPSVIHNQGVFCTANIRKGTPIIRFGGSLFNVSERFSERVKPSTSIALSEVVLLAESFESERDLSDYINHSCNPNCGMSDAITLYAIKDLFIGDEILVDYAFWEAREDYVMKDECRCGADNCRKVITGDSEKYSERIEINGSFFQKNLASHGGIKGHWLPDFETALQVI
jgi:hypothetical protein